MHMAGLFFEFDGCNSYRECVWVSPYPPQVRWCRFRLRSPVVYSTGILLQFVGGDVTRWSLPGNFVRWVVSSTLGGNLLVFPLRRLSIVFQTGGRFGYAFPFAVLTCVLVRRAEGNGVGFLTVFPWGRWIHALLIPCIFRMSLRENANLFLY